MKIINYVVGKDNKSKIFYDIFTRFSNYLSIKCPDKYYLTVTEQPIDNADLYHYHRPQFKGITHHPSVVTIHHDLNDTDLSLDEKIFIQEYEKANLTICLNTNQENYLKNYDIPNVMIIPHGYDNKLSLIDSSYNKDSKLTIGFISKRYGRRVKGEVYLEEILNQLSPQKVKFIFVGAGRREETILARSLGFEVECYEYLPYVTLLSLYSKIDYLLMCSDSEGGPANIPEALGSKTPVLAFNIGLVSDLVIDGKNGFILSGKSKEDALLIKRIYDNNEITENILKNWESTESLLTWEQVFEKHINAYDKTLLDFNHMDVNYEAKKLLLPLNNIKLDFIFPKIIKKEQPICLNVMLINDEHFLSEELVTNSNMFIAIKENIDGEECEVLRFRLEQEIVIGTNRIKINLDCGKYLIGKSFTLDLLCDHLGWFNVCDNYTTLKFI